MDITVRPATTEDFEAIWPIFRQVVRAGDTYGYDPGTTREQARVLWLEMPQMTFVATRGERVLGTYYLKPNQSGPGRHVCNCGYMVAEEARGQGIAAIMCQHSQQIALESGYLAMQFNFVSAANEVAVRLWRKLGYTVAGTLPSAFRDPRKGLVDAYVMYKWLSDVHVVG